MSVVADDLGVLRNLAVALGVFTPQGEPNPDWFGDPEASLKTMLADDDQRSALIAFVDDAMGGADRTTDPSGVVWLPIVSVDDPDLTVAVTVDDSPADGIHVGLGISVRTATPASTTSFAVPLFRTQKEGGPAVTVPLLLGSPGGRIRIATSITIDAAPVVPGQAHLGAIGLDVDVPTTPADPKDPVFGLTLSGLQLPGATSPRDLRVAADGLDELDDALLDFVLSLIKAQADAAPSGSPIAAIAGLLGLVSADTIPDFPITELPTQGVHAFSAWMHGIMTTTASRNDWLGYVADLVGGSLAGDAVQFDLGGDADLTIGLAVDTGPSGNARLTPQLGVELGTDQARIEARADLLHIDLVTGSTTAVPSLGVWGAAGRPGQGNRVLDVTTPTVARADVLRVGFSLDGGQLTFVLAADGVKLGAHDYPTLDLTSPDAVMDAIGHTVEDVANQLLGNLGDALTTARLLLGLDAPAGVTAITLAALMNDPVAAVSGYWHALAAAPPGAMTSVLAEVRSALADASEAAMPIQGTGGSLDPWRVPLIGPLELELVADGSVVSLALAASTRVDSLGQRCTVVETRLAATVAEIDLAARTGSLLPGVEAVLSARERGVSPPRVTLPLTGNAALTASGVGVRLAWTPTAGLSASMPAPNMQLVGGDLAVPVALPVVGPDGNVALAAEGWDGVQALLGYLGELLGGPLGGLVQALGWTTPVATAGGDASTTAQLRLADLVVDPAQAFAGWLPQLALSDLGPEALRLVADAFTGSGASQGILEGTGHPDDPYRFALTDGLPNIAVWFPPAGLERRQVAAPEALQQWRPGDPGLSPDALASALAAEATVADDVRALIDERDIVSGLTALAARWAGGDGRIVPPQSPPDGVTVIATGIGVGQLIDQLDLEDLTGRIPTTTVYVALGADAWPDAPADRRVDLTAEGLEATMFAAPTAATGDWFVALGGRSASLLAGSTTDATPEQAARLARVLDALASVSSDIAVVAVAGAGHAARLAAQPQAAVTDLLTLGTPLGPIALSAISTQPTADALRLLHRLLPPPTELDVDPEAEVEDDDLALGRALVDSMMELVDRPDPSADLRPPAVPPDPPRAGLAVTAVFGVVSDTQISRAITAIVAAGLAERARLRAATPLPEPTGVGAGVRLDLAPTTTGSVSISGDALLTLFSYDTTSGVDTSRHLRARLRIGDRLGWLSATPDLELRMVTADVSVPLDGAAHGDATVTLHDARVFGQSWEQLVVGGGPDAVPVLPEARTLLAAAIQRVAADTAGSASVALAELLTALGIIAPTGGVAGDAVDQLIRDPGGLVRERLAAAGDELSAAVAALLGPLAASIDIAARSVHIAGGDDGSGRYGWHADVAASPAGLAGRLRVGAEHPAPPAGGLNLLVDLDPLHVSLLWHQPGGVTDTVELWPAPDPAAIARTLAKAGPSVGGHVALETMRRADEEARPVVDAVLDAFGVLGGSLGDADRQLRPLAGLIADPAGWLRSSDSLAASPAKIQGVLDALRPLVGIGGAPGTPFALADGVELSVVAAGAGASLVIDIDAGAWTAPGNATGRLAAGVGAALTVGPAGPPALALDVHVGMAGAAPGRQAIHAVLGGSGIQVFMRPTTGADIPLVPFAGLGSLAAAAEAALPFLLDRLAAVPGTVGDLVGTVGDAFALRSGVPERFDGARLQTWAADPVAALTTAVPSIVSTGLDQIAPAVDAFVPGGVTVTSTPTTLSATVGDVSLSWTPGTGVVALAADGLSVPGVDQVSFTLAISAAGPAELSVTAGPAAIDAGGVTLKPFVTVAGGLSPAGGRRVAVGLALDDTQRFAARWLIDTHHLDLVSSTGSIASPLDTTDPTEVALRIVEVTADLVAAVAMAQQPVADLLDTPIGATTARNMLRGVVLRDVADPAELIPGLFDPATLLDRGHRLFSNIADANPSITVDGFSFAFTRQSNTIGVEVGLTERFPLLTGDVLLWLENENTWIDPRPPAPGGVFVGFLPDTQPFAFAPSLIVDGVGLRVGKSSGPLLDFGLTLDSIAIHAYAELTAAGARSGGAQLELSGLGVAASGAGGDNGIAQGVMRDTGPTPPKPSFSPALAIQKHGNGPVSVSLRAGEGDGPWWIAIQKGFGPLYLEQVGFGTRMVAGRVERVSVLMDGSVSMFGLTCAVDDLQITYIVANGDLFDPDNWQVDLAGLAVSANMAGVSIAGGLLKQSTEAGIEYLGMLLGRFAVYGITIFGGYGEGVAGTEKFTAFFAVGAVNGPIGGPPAFFLTGIGGGFGINRKLVVPTDLSRFGDYPLIQALDIAAQPQDPMAQLRALGQYFPMEKGTFWFAAGISFNSFALVDGIAVVAVEVGDGLDINLLGLARMALPRPQVALVSIELALLVRFSSSEGVLWVQGQLTDNSWLLYKDVKLTGGFAYVMWFKGEHAGEFVLTLGGYHPDFHRDGYPQVPRLGLRWSFGSAIVIKSGSYFALTSEAIMAGGSFEASAHFGPAWAEVKFGADGIVYFDPFHYQVSAYARISAGVTIDTWLFGEITISVSLGARIEVSGPDFHGKASFDVGPVGLTVEFGGSDHAQLQPLSAAAFISKYLAVGDGGAAQAHAVMTSSGAQPAKAQDATPDGSSARPFVVVVEFSLTFTTTVPATIVTRTQAAANATTTHTPSRALGVAPMLAHDQQPTVTLTWKHAGVAQPFPFVATARPFGRFPVGIWGPAQDMNNRKVPKAEMIEALNELDLVSQAAISAPGPEIPYYQVEIGERKPLPFTRASAAVVAKKNEAKDVTQLLTEPSTVPAAFEAASVFLARTSSPTALAALRGERQSPPLLGSLAERLQEDAAGVKPVIGKTPPGKTYDHFVDAPVAVGLLSGATVDLRVTAAAHTTVKDSARAWRVTAPTLASVEAKRSRSIAARLVVRERNAVRKTQRTVIGATGVPPSAVAHAAPVILSRAGAPGADQLAGFNEALTRGRRVGRGTPGATLAAGQTVVLKLPNARADAALDVERPRLGVTGAPARTVVLGNGGRLLTDAIAAADGDIAIERGAERILALGQPTTDGPNTALAGWHAGMQLPYAGWSTALAPGCVVHSAGEPLPAHPERLDAGWVSGAELARGVSTVTTTFAEAPSTVVIVLDDPAAFGDPVGGRQLLLGLDAADRAQEGGEERPPVLLAMENRSVLAYDVVPDGTGPVVVTIASELGWSLVGVMGSSRLDAVGAIALISARGLDAAVRPFAESAAGTSRLHWLGPTRTPAERQRAQALAAGRPPAVAGRVRRPSKGRR